MLNLGGHQLIQCVCFQNNLYIFPCATHIYRNHHSNTVCGAAILFRINGCFVDCLLYRTFVDVGISVDSGFHRLGLTGGRGIRVVLVWAVDVGGILVRRIFPVVGRISTAAARFLLRCQRNQRFGLVVFRIFGFDRFDLELPYVGYCNSAVCIHCCGTADYRPCDCALTGTAGGLQRKAASLVDFARCADDGKSRLLCLAHGKCTGFSCFSAVVNLNFLAVMFCDRQHRSLGRVSGQLAAFPCESLTCIVVVVHLYRQTAQIQRLSAGIGQVGRLIDNLNPAHRLFRSCDCHALADGFCMVCSSFCFCKEIVGGVGGQTREYTLRLPVCEGFICDVVAVSNRCAGVSGFYHSLV